MFEQAANSNRHLVALYMDQIDRNMEEIDKYLRIMVAFENDLIKQKNRLGGSTV